MFLLAARLFTDNAVDLVHSHGCPWAVNNLPASDRGNLRREQVLVDETAIDRPSARSSTDRHLARHPRHRADNPPPDTNPRGVFTPPISAPSTPGNAQHDRSSTDSAK